MANRNPPGYVSPANRQLRLVGARVRPETIVELAAAAAAAGLTKRQAVAQAIRDFAVKHGVTARKHTP